MMDKPQIKISIYFYKGILIAFYLLAINGLFAFILFNFSPTFKKVNEIYQFKDKDFEYLFLGNSSGFDGIASPILNENNFTSYNFCIGGTHISTSTKILKHYLNFNKAPKKVFICLTSSMESTFLKKYTYDEPCFVFFFEKNLFEKWSTIFFKEFEWLYIELLKTLVSKPHREAKIIEGYWQISKTIADETKFEGKQLVQPYYRSSHLDDFVKLTREKELETVGIEMPGWRKYRNNEPKIYDIKTLSKLNLKVLNFNNYQLADSLLNDKSDWLSLNHLNKSGAAKLTTFLVHNYLAKK
jgi:hypothetical protein